MNKGSALIIAVAIIMGCVILGVFLREPPPDLEARVQDYEKRLSMQNGRYQIVSGSGGKGGNIYFYLVDTHTGKCWYRIEQTHSAGRTADPRDHGWTPTSPNFSPD